MLKKDVDLEYMEQHMDLEDMKDCNYYQKNTTLCDRIYCFHLIMNIIDYKRDFGLNYMYILIFLFTIMMMKKDGAVSIILDPFNSETN